jgi:hypothetical protein
MRAFGAEAYFVNIPSKFISEDGTTAWLCYAANFAERVQGPRHTVHSSTPEGSRYGMCFHEFRLDAR